MQERRRARTVSKREPFVAWVELDVGRVDSFASYPFSLPCVEALKERLQLDGSVTFFVGENGSGKSTLVEGIAVALGYNAEGGTRNFNFATRRSESPLGKSLRVARSHRRPRTGYFLRAESFFNVASNIEELDREPAMAPPIIDSYGGHSLHEQSHGESFMALVRHRFGPSGLYILDEPESALSPSRQLELLREMRRHCLQGSQFIVASHSPLLLAYPDACIYQLSRSGIARVAYEDTEHYRVTRRFLEQPREQIHELFADIGVNAAGSGAEDLEVLLDRAQRLAASAEHDEAISLCSASIQQHPLRAEPYHQRALSTHALGRIVPALQDLARAIQLSPTQPKYYVQRGLWRCDLGAFGPALEDLSQAYTLGGGLTLEPNTRADADSDSPGRSLSLARAVLLFLMGDYEQSRREVAALDEGVEVRIAQRLWTLPALMAELERV